VAAPTSLVGPASAGVDPCGLVSGIYGYCHPHCCGAPHSGEFWNAPCPPHSTGGCGIVFLTSATYFISSTSISTAFFLESSTLL